MLGPGSPGAMRCHPMIGIFYSTTDETSLNIAASLVGAHGFKASEPRSKLKVYESGQVRVYETDAPLLDADFIDSLGIDIAFFLSRHESAAGVASFTTHSLGNWGPEAKLGGKPKELSHAAPVAMLYALRSLDELTRGARCVYEATHHGPLTETPSVFIEVGGDAEALGSKENASMAADAAYDSIASYLEDTSNYRKVAIGIGGGHYPEGFSRLAMANDYAFSHIMPKYAMESADGTYNLDVLEQCLDRTTHRPEVAVVDWQGLGSMARAEAIKKLNDIGLDYEKL